LECPDWKREGLLEVGEMKGKVHGMPRLEARRIAGGRGNEGEGAWNAPTGNEKDCWR